MFNPHPYNNWRIEEPHSQFDHLPENKLKSIYDTANSIITEEQSPAIYHHYRPTIERQLREDFNLVESHQNKSKKEDVLLKLNDILKTWMSKVNKNLLEEDPKNHPILKDPKSELYKQKYTARLLCFGSYKLGVSTPTGDIDALVLSPYYVDRERDFFGILYGILKKKASYNKQITDLTFVNLSHSITPLIKMEFYDVSVDLVFACVQDITILDGTTLKSGLSVRPNLNNNQCLKYMDKKMQASYNGFRNAEMILNSIVDMINDTEEVKMQKIQRYRTFLRCVKLWAKRKGVNENKFGFWGGIALAILSAKIFQMYPYYSPVHLLERFFYIYGFEWDWDKWYVKIVDEPSDTIENDRHGKMKEKKRFMYIKTPAPPQINCSYNVSYSTREVILKLMKESYHHLHENLKTNTLDFLKFYKPLDFFKKHDQYLEIIIVGNNEEKFLAWKGYIEAKLRFLTEQLEDLMYIYDFSIQIWPRTYSEDEIQITQKYHSSLENFKLKEKMYIGLSLEVDYDYPVNLETAVNKFLTRIQTGWENDNKKARDAKALNLFIYVIDKEQFCMENQGDSIKKSPNLEPRVIDFWKNQKSHTRNGKREYDETDLKHIQKAESQQNHVSGLNSNIDQEVMDDLFN